MCGIVGYVGPRQALPIIFEGLRRFAKGNLTMIGEETAPTMRADVKRGLENGAVEPLDEQLSVARRLGLKVYACPNAMASLEIQLLG